VPHRADGQAGLGGDVAQRRGLQAVAVDDAEDGVGDRVAAGVRVDDLRHGSL
jgi:hypothetical protein